MTAPAPGGLGGGWADLAAQVAACTACPELVAARTRVVVGHCPPGARLLLVGEAPGAEEDRTGQPFVGRSGQLLDRLLAQAGLDRAAVAVLNVLKCRPPGNRSPRRAEVARCRGWLDRQVDLVDPGAVVTLGGTAATWALGRGATIGALRAGQHAVRGRPLLVTYHPSAALRGGPDGPVARAMAADLRRAAGLLAAARPGGHG